MSDIYLVIGGEGFLGHWIVDLLLKRGDKNVSTFDLSQRYFDEKVTYYAGDLCNYRDVDDAIKKSNATTVFHTVSPPHVGAPAEVYWKVNVEGTKNVVESCITNGVKKLVYTSSSSVIYDGVHELIGVDETTPYPEKPMDVYNETKMEGEKLVINANGRGGLLVAIIRPSAIFGPNDRQLIPAVIKVMQQGQTKIQIGNNYNLVDYTYVENAAHAHILASDKLFDGSPVAGEVFIITNGSPIPFWDLLRYIWAQFDHFPPYIVKFPGSLGFFIALLTEFACRFTGKEAGLNRFRVKFTINNRYFNINKAKKLLGYEPLVELDEAYFKRYQVKYRRRREGKTDYYARKRLVVQAKNKYNSPKYRLVVRFTNTDIIVQIIYAKLEGDHVMTAAYSHELPSYGIKVGLTNWAAAYSTGLLAARRVLTKLKLADKYVGVAEPDGTVSMVEELEDAPHPFKAFLDVGLKRTSTGSKVFAALKGSSDGGIFIPHSENRFPGYDAESKKIDSEILRKYIYGGHVADYMRLLQEEDDEKYKRQFSKFIEAGLSADDLENVYKEAHAKIRANPVFKPTEKKGDYKIFKKYKKHRLNLKQRRNKVEQKIAAFKRSQGGDDDDE
ncbi:18243_t:CDS:2 [Acaulospora morrowiae]|uniref:18243_t:CDS:1 n=1 Tax=Acaulospora morrowiae TaxID=94023 RepID=A0A9N8Z5S4_9GLOM|nr:18243_t:CDS:2 [Acaulospora morrowiae]